MARICGVDEAGRGPLAGPVTAAAVVLPPGFPIGLLDDSKALTRTERERLYALLCAEPAAIGVGWAWPEEIDRLNIHRATLLAMRRAITSIPESSLVGVDLILVDGKFTPAITGGHWSCEGVGPRSEAVVHGDALIPEIMAASIVAKVSRDRWMTRYGWIETGYGYDRHMGYPTVEHRRACIEHGASPIQRMSFSVRID